MLFEVIPDHFFRVFSGPRRHINAYLIKRLYNVYYGDDADLEVPLASEVRAFLISEIRTLPEHLQQTLDRDGAPPSPETEGHEFFRKLVTSYKWLKITRDLGKKYVQFTAVAHSILDFFMGLRSALSEDFTIDLAGILSSLETTVNKSDPHACLSAQKQTRELVKKLKALSASLVDIEEQFFTNKDLKSNIHLLMQEFFDNILIKEIAPLVTQNHPIRYRTRIIELCNELRSDRSAVMLLGRSLSKASKYGEMEAIDVINDSLSFISRAFDIVPALMRQVDTNRRKLETRIDNTTKYMELSAPTDTEKLRLVLANISRHPVEENEFDFRGRGGLVSETMQELFPWPFLSEGWSLIDDVCLTFPTARKRVVVPKRQRRQKRNKAADRRIRAIRQWELFLEGDPEIARTIIEKTICKGEPFRSAEMKVDGLSDFILFDQLRSLETVFEGVLREDYQIDRAELGENDFAIFRHFTITPRHKDGGKYG